MSEPPAKKLEIDVLNIELGFDFSDPKIFHDRVLVVGEKKFHVQSGLLMIWSEYFTGLFGSSFQESNSGSNGEVEIKEVNEDEFNNFLQLIYPTDFKITEKSFEGLFRLARRFLAPKVHKLCNQFIHTEFINLDKIKLIKLAFEYDLVDMKAKLARFIAASPSVEVGRSCSVCKFPRGLAGFCVNEPSGTTSIIQANSFVHTYFDQIAEFPLEIKDFISRAVHFKFD